MQMTIPEKVADLLARNFLLMANWQAEDRQLIDIDADDNLTLLDTNGLSRLVPFDDVADIGFASRLVPDRYLPITEYDTDLSARFSIFCQLTDVTNGTASELLGRTVRLDELHEPDDWKTICAGLIGL
ncbi:hypothetical protein [uncultured Fibrella sp.]|uniref:hypothetical protein n=1 Tax=uncultured Fibrella sp. TaxID=1284596 RepID=UPI0035CC18B6